LSRRITNKSDIINSSDIGDLSMSPIETIKRRLEEYSEVMRQARPTNNLFKSLIIKPRNVSLNIQEKDEQILLIARQHLITKVKNVVALILTLIIIPLSLHLSGFLSSVPLRFAIAFYIGFIVIGLGMTLKTFLIWFFNVYVITDERIIDVDFHSIIYKNVSSARLESIEDVTSRSVGPVAAVFNYGTILIQTAGARVQFEFDHIPDPAKIKRLLNELLAEERRLGNVPVRSNKQEEQT
jgi:hypothetical protein